MEHYDCYSALPVRKSKSPPRKNFQILGEAAPKTNSRVGYRWLFHAPGGGCGEGRRRSQGQGIVLIPWAAINFIADEHRSTVLQPPYGPRVRQSAVSFPHARRKDFLGTHCLGDLFRGRCSPAARPFSLSPFLSSGLLPLLFRPHREGLRNLLARHAAQLPLQVLNLPASPLRVPDWRPATLVAALPVHRQAGRA